VHMARWFAPHNTIVCLPAIAAVVVSVVMGVTGCAPIGSSYDYTVFESELELVFSSKYRILVLIRANGQDAFDMVESETTIISPRFSPDGNMIAFYDLGVSSGLPVSSRDVSLVVSDLGWEGAPEDGFVSFSLLQFDTDHRLIVDDVIPPLWAPDGRSVFVAHNTGIEQVFLSGKREDVVADGKIRTVSITRTGDQLVYSDGANIFLLDIRARITRSILDPGFVPQFGNKYIRALALSPDEKHVVFAVGHELYVLDFTTRGVQRIHEAVNRVYWLEWSRGRDRIFFLSGREFGGRGALSPAMYETEGKFALYSMTPAGDDLHKLFSNSRLDARQAIPDLSPDDRYISLTARAGGVKEVVLVATDGSGVSVLTAGGPNCYASWRRTVEIPVR
ncbi:MAG: hypothetical protein JSW50_02295, partial [Candidatus Latescibacterota bacterium]